MLSNLPVLVNNIYFSVVINGSLRIYDYKLTDCFCGCICTSLFFKGLQQSAARFFQHSKSNYFKFMDDFLFNHFSAKLETV